MVFNKIIGNMQTVQLDSVPKGLCKCKILILYSRPGQNTKDN